MADEERDITLQQLALQVTQRPMGGDPCRPRKRGSAPQVAPPYQSLLTYLSDVAKGGDGAKSAH